VAFALNRQVSPAKRCENN